MKDEDPDHHPNRKALRFIGLIILITGIALIAVGMHDIFTADLNNQPTLHYLPMIGMPLVFVGLSLLSIGQHKHSGPYAGDITPPGGNTVIYMGNGTQPGVNVGMAHGQGTSGEPHAANDIPPPDYLREQFGCDDESSKPKGTIRERLEKLQTLHKDGLIDDMDFEDQKDRILKDL